MQHFWCSSRTRFISNAPIWRPREEEKKAGDLRSPPDGGGGPPTLIDLASANTAWTKEPEAKAVATRLRTALRLVSASAEPCWALMLKPDLAKPTRFPPPTLRRVELLSWRPPSSTAWEEPRKPAIEAIAWAIFAFNINSQVLLLSKFWFKGVKWGNIFLWIVWSFFNRPWGYVVWSDLGHHLICHFPAWITWIWSWPLPRRHVDYEGILVWQVGLGWGNGLLVFRHVDREWFWFRTSNSHNCEFCFPELSCWLCHYQ